MELPVLEFLLLPSLIGLLYGVVTMELASLYSSFALSPLAWYLVWLPRTYCPSTPNTADPISKYLIPAPCMALFAHAPSNLSPRCKVHCSFSFPYIVLPDTSIPIFIHVGIGAFTFFFPSTIPSPSYPIDNVQDLRNTFIYLPWMMVQLPIWMKNFKIMEWDSPVEFA